MQFFFFTDSVLINVPDSTGHIVIQEAGEVHSTCNFVSYTLMLVSQDDHNTSLLLLDPHIQNSRYSLRTSQTLRATTLCRKLRIQNPGTVILKKHMEIVTYITQLGSQGTLVRKDHV